MNINCILRILAHNMARKIISIPIFNSYRLRNWLLNPHIIYDDFIISKSGKQLIHFICIKCIIYNYIVINKLRNMLKKKSHKDVYNILRIVHNYVIFISKHWGKGYTLRKRATCLLIIVTINNYFSQRYLSYFYFIYRFLLFFFFANFT